MLVLCTNHFGDINKMVDFPDAGKMVNENRL